ncbi:MAG: hypothetical protein RBU37_02905, partial [Myxococcota bacterium]|nr:hypothetical protein [Myxococcota bacterium]
MSTRQWTAQERDADQGDGLYARLLAAALHRLGSDNSVQPPAEAMPQDWVQLDWPQLCDAIAERCVSDEAAGLAKEHPLFEQPDCLRLHQNLILESACLIEKGDRPDLLHVPALSTVLARASRDAVLSAEQLGLVCEALEASNRLRRFFDHRREEAPLAWELAEPMQRLDEVERRLRRAFGPDGRLSDDASPELGHLRRRVLRLHEQMRSRLEEKLKSRDMEDLLQDSFYTQREGRYVLPIRVHARTQLEGIVHASSGSGQTVFMEPREFIEINNQIRLSEIEVEEEEERILRNLTEVVGSIAGALAHNLRRLFYLDLVQAGAQLALDLRSNAPHIAARIELGRARHPLLQLRLGAQGRDVVPNQIALPVESRALVISGANAGGKTVTLKTIGLFALLLRAGQPLPAAPGSEFPLFNEVFADIGDEQSIVQDTSTFSAHVIKLRQILPRVGPGSLVLLDEPFAGTDPAQGGALTMALLERLYIAGATVVVT